MYCFLSSSTHILRSETNSDFISVFVIVLEQMSHLPLPELGLLEENTTIDSMNEDSYIRKEESMLKAMADRHLKPPVFDSNTRTMLSNRLTLSAIESSHTFDLHKIDQFNDFDEFKDEEDTRIFVDEVSL